MSGFITEALWNWFLGWPWWAHVMLAAGAVLALWGIIDRVIVLASKIGGWKAGLGVALGLLALVAAFWPRKHVPTDDQYAHPDPKVMRPKGKRVYNPDTNEWE